MGELHNRMPVILDQADWPKWLGEEPATEEELLAMLKPCPDEALKIWAVDKMVGNVRNKGPQLAMPLRAVVPDRSHSIRHCIQYEHSDEHHRQLSAE